MDVSHQAEVEKAPRGRRSTAALWRMSVGGVFVSRQVFGTGRGCRRCRERISFLIRQEQKRHRVGEKRKKAKNGEATRGRGIAECRNFGRQRERLPAAHRRATIGVNCAGRISRFSSSFGTGRGCRRCRERISFLVRRWYGRHRAGEKRKKAKNGGNYPGQGVGRM